MPHRVVIIGGGFGGLYAAQALRRAPVELTLIDRRNFHLFQPLLYQVATGGLSPGEIASPLRYVLRKSRNTEVLLGEVVDLDVAGRRVILRDGEAAYDTLIVATGSSHHYFGNDQWAPLAPGLKTIEDATEIRRRILLAFEKAEREPDAAARAAWLTFVVVGAGPTGVELAGALGEIANDTLRHDFRHIVPAESRILLLEGGGHVLPAYPADLSAQAEESLIRLGVRPITGAVVTAIDEGGVLVRRGTQEERIATHTVLWAAGVAASPMGRILAERCGAKLDGAGRVIVEPDLSVAGHPEVLVIGDLANFSHQTGKPLPGVAPVAMQEGRYAAALVHKRLAGKTMAPFHYHDKGSLATIGRAAAVADFGRIHIHGMAAWITWLFVHLLYLVEFDNRLLVLIQWAYNYITRNRGARLITGDGYK
ncbi:MAG TPA: NAD(P)/FAD-dependent oxidoreductase [Bryobacteraceae bacterium]|nr:NAD(P)/FAD-dependent oxidoreductase [Bryobacteraceae bacterium]